MPLKEQIMTSTFDITAVIQRMNKFSEVSKSHEVSNTVARIANKLLRINDSNAEGFTKQEQNIIRLFLTKKIAA
jgi:hypothetical protein